jgi:hypothetical protein
LPSGPTNHLARWFDHRLAILVHQGSDPTPPYQALVIRESAFGKRFAPLGRKAFIGPRADRGNPGCAPLAPRQCIFGAFAVAKRERGGSEAGATGDGKRPVAAHSSECGHAPRRQLQVVQRHRLSSKCVTRQPGEKCVTMRLRESHHGFTETGWSECYALLRIHFEGEGKWGLSCQPRTVGTTSG